MKVIVKVGTGVLTRESNGQLNPAALGKLVDALCALVGSGNQVILVSSGAVGAGLSALQLSEYPQSIVERQICAAVGQARLMRAYENAFEKSGYHVAQVLLTASDFENAQRRGTVRSLLAELEKRPQIVPIVNENDSVATEELKVGDNDMLSASLAEMVGADRLILLTTVDGLMHPESWELIEEVSDVRNVLELAVEKKGKLSIGGMASKLQAILKSSEAGIETIIANGAKPERLPELVTGSGIGTRFLAKK